ncbi:hypothetical protein GCM10018790_42080 [Kitasatospora xanthocidica]|nr:hypothetical protein GCM10018790_42080 [Kitasatospora xanthocidica]
MPESPPAEDPPLPQAVIPTTATVRPSATAKARLFIRTPKVSIRFTKSLPRRDARLRGCFGSTPRTEGY